MRVFLKNILHPLGIAGTVVALAIPLSIYALPHLGFKDLISNLDLNAPFWIFAMQFLLGIGLAINLRKDFWEWFAADFRPEKQNTKQHKDILTVSIIALLALFVCIAWISPRHRVQSDESIFLATAQNLYANQIAGSCDEGEFENGHLDCKKSAHNFKTKGEPFLYALGIAIFGNDLHWVFPLHLFLLAATIFLLYFAVRTWTANKNLAFLTAAIFAAQPTALFQFRSASVEPLYTFLFALCVFLWKWAWDKNTLKHWVFFALALAFFAQTRQETVFCLGAFVFMSLPKILDKKDFKAPIFFAVISFFCIPVLLTISHYQGYNFQGGAFSAHGHFFENLRQAWNITVNTPLENGLLRNPFLSSFSILTAAGIIILIFCCIKTSKTSPKNTDKNNPRFILLFFALYFPQVFMILENVSGDLSIEINQRYTLVMFPAMAFFSAFAIEKVSKLFPKDNQTLFVFIAAAVLWANSLQYKTSFEKNIMYNRNHLTIEEQEILKWVYSDNVDAKNKLFVYSRPWHFIGYGMSSVHYNSLTPQKLDDYIKKYNGEVYYIRGLDCWDSQTYHKKAVEHRIANVCDNFERIFPMDFVHSAIITNNYRLVVAKLKAGGIGENPFVAKKVNIELPKNSKWLGEPVESRQDWGALQINKSVTGRPITINKKRYENGIGTHANGMLRYNLNVEYKRLTAILGLDESEFCSNGARVKIFGDGKLLADTQNLKPSEEFQVNIPLAGVKELLFTTDALGDIGCDHIDIAVPILYEKE